MPKITFAEALQCAALDEMRDDPSVVCFGLGVTDPKRVFGTTDGLLEEFGPSRVFEIPTSENAGMGLAVGMALRGKRPIFVHQRMDFFLLAMDQLVNSAAKWRFMFGGSAEVPLTVRLVVGRGWGQGPTHSQNLYSWFAHIPGLRVIAPAFPQDAYDLMRWSVREPNPVIFIEHRWLHGQVGKIRRIPNIPVERASVRRLGTDLTIISSSYATVEALRAAEFLESVDIDVEIVDVPFISPFGWETVFESSKKTGRVVVLETSNVTGSFSGEIAARISEEVFDHLKVPVVRLGHPDWPEPTSRHSLDGYHVSSVRILNVIREKFGFDFTPLPSHGSNDIPGPWFSGPF